MNVKDEIVYAANLAYVAAQSIADFQDAVSGPPELSADLSTEDIEILDAAYQVLANFYAPYFR